MKKPDKKKITEYATIALVVLAAIAFLYISGIGCPIRYMTGIPCPGCGMTRAVVSLLQLQFNEAFRYHPMIYVLPILVIFYILARCKGKSGNAVLWIGGICFVVIYLVRILILNDPVLEIDVMSGRILRRIMWNI